MEVNIEGQPIWLTHEEIDQIASQLSASDVIEATSAEGRGGRQLLYDAFSAGAKRLGYGERITDRIKPGDYKYLGGKLAEVFDFASPTSAGTED